MSTELHFARDDQGYNADSPQFPTDIFTATLATGTATSVTVPKSNAAFTMYVSVQPNGWCWCSRTTTAAIPAGGTLAAAKSELVAGTREYRRTVFGGDTISLITANTTCDVEVSFQSIKNP